MKQTLSLLKKDKSIKSQGAVVSSWDKANPPCVVVEEDLITCVGNYPMEARLLASYVNKLVPCEQETENEMIIMRIKEDGV